MSKWPSASENNIRNVFEKNEGRKNFNFVLYTNANLFERSYLFLHSILHTKLVRNNSHENDSSYFELSIFLNLYV